MQLHNGIASTIEVDSQYWRRNNMAENTITTQTKTLAISLSHTIFV